MARGVWGLDVSKSCLKAVRLELNDELPEITDVDIIDYTPAVSRDDVALEQEIRMALSLFTSRHNLRKDNIAASLPGHSTFNRFIKLPPTDPARLKDIIQYEAQQHIPFPINEVVWAYQLVERQYQPGEDLEAVLFAIKKELIDQFLGTMALAGVQIDIIQFAPVALYNFVTYSGLVQKSGVILDMGANNTDLILIDDNKFWIRNLPIVGNDITHAIEKKFELQFAEAEKLKVSAAQSPQAGKIFTTIQPVLKDLVGEVHRSIGYYKSLSPMGKPPAFTKMVAMGNATRVIYFDEFVSQRLQMELVRFKKLEKFEVSPKLDPAVLTTQLPSLGVAIGLGLQYLGQTINRINLLPQEIIRIKQATKRKPFIAAIAAIVTIIVIMLWWTSGKTLDALKELSEKVAVQTKTWKEIDRKYKNVSDMTEFEEKLKRLVQTVPNREIWGKLFNALNSIDALKDDPNNLPTSYIEKTDIDKINQMQEAWHKRIWILRLEAKDRYKGEENAQKHVLEVTIYCGMMCKMQNGVPDGKVSRDFVNDEFGKRLSDAFNIALPPDPTLQKGAVPDLKIGDLEGMNDEQAPKESPDRKYYRFKIVLDIPL